MKLLLAVVLALLATSALADTRKVTAGSVEWAAKGKPRFIGIDGKGGKVTGTVTMEGGKVTGAFECAMADFTTGFGMRDGHMRGKYLEVAKFPTALLVLDPIEFKPGVEVQWTGSLTLKAVAKPIKGTATINADSATAKFIVNLDNYPVGVPSFEGVTVASDVAVTVKVQVGK